MAALAELETMIPYPAPTAKVARTLLLAVRRLAIAGLDDAHVTNLLISEFGLAYRKPLMFIRILLSEIARVSTRQITLAPCCCPRMTVDEALVLNIIAAARAEPNEARAGLARLAGTLDHLPALSVAQALADILDDIGHPLEFAILNAAKWQSFD